MKNMMEIAKEFFEMPVGDRASLYSEDTKKPVRVLQASILPTQRTQRSQLGC